MKKWLVIAVATVSVCAYAVDETKASDEAIEKAAETLLHENETANSAWPAASHAVQGQVQVPSQTAPTTLATPAKESEIPVFLDSKKADSAKSNVAWRLVASLLLVAIVGGTMMVAGKRWTRRKDRGGQKARIEMLHQFHLGHRKSLALVRVSGEAVLIGISDHNVNLIKTVALIDDELEGLMKRDFNEFLEDEFSVEDVRTALSARA